MEVGRVTTNDAAERDNRVVSTSVDDACGRWRQLPRSRHVNDFCVVKDAAVLFDACERAAKKTFRDVGIETTHQDREPEPGRVQ